VELRKFVLHVVRSSRCESREWLDNPPSLRVGQRRIDSRAESLILYNPAVMWNDNERRHLCSFELRTTRSCNQLRISSVVLQHDESQVGESEETQCCKSLNPVWQVDKDALHRYPLVRCIIICVATIQVPSQYTLSRIRRVQIVTITWMSIEAVLSLWSAWKARSPVLAAFGGDSAIELLSAIIVLWRFRDDSSEEYERRAARMTGGLLIVLGACVVLVSSISLLGYSEPKPSYFGMVVLLAALLIMPLLAREKRRLSAITGSAALRADSAQSGLCAYLSLIALLGVGVRSGWHINWADPVAALAVTPFILFEARAALKGKACRCC
jgi:hypothetical protein